jgi:ribosome modulation factor
MATILTNEANQGYGAAVAGHGATNRCPYLATSDSANAWHIGAWLKQTGRSVPRDVRTSRGNTYHVNDMKVRFVDPANIERIG